MKLKFGDAFQIALIGLGVLATLLFGVFFMRELFPEYKEYQKKFIQVEHFRSSYTGESPAPFSYGVKQLVFEKEDKGPAEVERCISCHVALQIPAYDPLDEANYVWVRLDKEIEALKAKGDEKGASKLQELKTQQVGEFVYDMAKVLRMHPLMAGESRPFEFHPLAEYGCVSCHNGNGMGLVTDRAHGPVFDGAYEVEEAGYKPQFLEEDIDNDPKISKVFNHKPSHRLLFQTSPIYVGALIQAKCVNCHEALPSPQRQETAFEGHQSDIQKMLQNYTRGEDLFLSQACYACHKIAGFSRGGVGPELTKEGEAYPWFVKESIVWPQADLKSSTMPNYRLDHPEIEDLLTFLLAQKGESRLDSGIMRQKKVAEWDAGKKLPWETEASPAEIKDVSKGMEIFATQGCAACHRLRGFEDAKNEKDSAWFKAIVPERVSGKGLYEAIQANKERLAGKADSPLLDTIETRHPGLLASFYPMFGYAARKSDDPAYQALLKQVLKHYIQEYGLGRQVGPNLSWSGVYRSDKWLMNHFINPQSESPRSIMPVFPFDETKFLQLTNMLNALGVKGQKALKQEWKASGFNPELAYKELCSQCHGDNLGGDGPVAEWIYPIPKNLRKAEFLRNLTREKARDSILHGVPGTPMPPWGEMGAGKEGSPVLSEAEVDLLVDWIFSFLSGSQVISKDKDVPKWQYGTENVLEELKKEGGDNPSVFGENGKFIKKSFYTPENLYAGEELFKEHCASCHGNEADGAGVRAEAMYDAKPRMLTNINWLESRDDLRLLQSIKYGVPGTSMQAWGDQTSMNQRLQLVAYIRSLSFETEMRKQIAGALYDSFDKEFSAIEGQEAKLSQEFNTALALLEEKKRELDKSETTEAFVAYKQAKDKVQKLGDELSKYRAVKENIQAQKDSFSQIGFGALAFSQAIVDKAFDLIKARGEKDNKPLLEQAEKKLLAEVRAAIAKEEEKALQLKGKIASLEVEETLNSVKSRVQVLRAYEEKITSEMKDVFIKLTEEKQLIEEIGTK